jgi:hypothetical protein
MISTMNENGIQVEGEKIQLKANKYEDGKNNLLYLISSLSVQYNDSLKALLDFYKSLDQKNALA